MTAEQIVRALAATDPVGGHDDGDYCPVCLSGASMGRPMGEPMAVADHAANCPWRQAVEFVAERASDPYAKLADAQKAIIDDNLRRRRGQ